MKSLHKKFSPPGVGPGGNLTGNAYYWVWSFSGSVFSQAWGVRTQAANAMVST